jgi:hypothetical protein
MTIRLAIPSLVGIGSLVLFAFACADADPVTDTPDNTPEGGALPPGPDAGELDASTDADAADLDAALPECSKEGFCHTTVPPKQTLRGVWSDGAGITWAISQEGAILRFDGKTWSVHTSDLGELFSIWGSGPTDVWVGGDGPLFHGQGATSGSLTFVRVDTPGGKNAITSIWGTSANDVWAIGGENTFPLEGRVLHYDGTPGKDDAGAEWSLEDAYPDPIWLLRVSGSPASGVWIAGTIDVREGMFTRRRTQILRRAAGSTDWLKVELPRDPDYKDDIAGDLEDLYDARASLDGLSMWVIGKTRGSIPALIRGVSADGGQTFTWSFLRASPTLNPRFNGIGAFSANDGWMVGDYGRVRHWDGTKFKQSVISVSKFPMTPPFYAAGGYPNDFWFVGEGVALHRVPSKVQP